MRSAQQRRRATLTGVPILEAVVPVAGLGTRRLPATKALPKAMLPIGRTPVAPPRGLEMTRGRPFVGGSAC